ncbi:hypothetical protein Purlil1_1346 [Purpureocillium lilacinum]|uniref:Uncharacterized protein n=1 Tax=Purpureocillium lilacinum TaxID=33203 RepID=A0ABR0CFP4_PURLI|nr:hypothetical protein Purlil1_1346 [Purpureocillium lilacinum]
MTAATGQRGRKNRREAASESKAPYQGLRGLANVPRPNPGDMGLFGWLCLLAVDLTREKREGGEDEETVVEGVGATYGGGSRGGLLPLANGHPPTPNPAYPGLFLTDFTYTSWTMLADPSQREYTRRRLISVVTMVVRALTAEGLRRSPLICTHLRWSTLELIVLSHVPLAQSPSIMYHLVDHALLRKPPLRVASSEFSGPASSVSESTLRPSPSPLLVQISRSRAAATRSVSAVRDTHLLFSHLFSSCSMGTSSVPDDVVSPHRGREVDESSFGGCAAVACPRREITAGRHYEAAKKKKAVFRPGTRRVCSRSLRAPSRPPRDVTGWLACDDGRTRGLRQASRRCVEYRDGCCGVNHNDRAYAINPCSAWESLAERAQLLADAEALVPGGKDARERRERLWQCLTFRARL